MNTSLSKGRFSGQTAFTLIELLVVITIIAVLAGLLLPVTQKVLENSRKVSCKNTELQIVTAVNSYQTEYGQYPVSVSSTATTQRDTTYGTANADTKNNGVLFDILRALNQKDDNGVILNPRRVVYFESKNVRNATEPKDGFIVTGTPKGNVKAPTRSDLKVGDLVDPWGNWYAVRFDSGYTNAVVNPYKTDSGGSEGNDDPVDPTTGPTATQLKENLRMGVVVWTYGYDGQAGDKGATIPAPYTPTPGDDVDSWQ